MIQWQHNYHKTTYLSFKLLQQIMLTTDRLSMTTNYVDIWHYINDNKFCRQLTICPCVHFKSILDAMTYLWFFVDSVLICTDLEMNNSLALSVWFCIIFWGRGSAQRISKTEIKTFNFVFRYDDVGPSINCPKVHKLVSWYLSNIWQQLSSFYLTLWYQMNYIFAITGIHLLIAIYTNRSCACTLYSICCTRDYSLY